MTYCRRLQMDWILIMDGDEAIEASLVIQTEIGRIGHE